MWVYCKKYDKVGIIYRVLTVTWEKRNGLVEENKVRDQETKGGERQHQTVLSNALEIRGESEEDHSKWVSRRKTVRAKMW